MKQVKIFDENGDVIDTLDGDLIIVGVGIKENNNIKAECSLHGEYIGLTRLFTYVGSNINIAYNEHLKSHKEKDHE